MCIVTSQNKFTPRNDSAGLDVCGWPFVLKIAFAIVLTRFQSARKNDSRLPTTTKDAFLLLSLFRSIEFWCVCADPSGANDLVAVGGTYANGVQSVLFERRVRTGDAKDKNISMGLQDIIWAFGTGDALNPQRHADGEYGTAQIDFYAGSTSPPGGFTNRTGGGGSEEGGQGPPGGGSGSGSSGTTTTTGSANGSSNFIQFRTDVLYTLQWRIIMPALSAVGSGSSSVFGGAASVDVRDVPIVQINLSLAKPAGSYWMAVGLGTAMNGSDIMMASLSSNGTAIVADRTGVGHRPVLDTSGTCHSLAAHMCHVSFNDSRLVFFSFCFCRFQTD